jgi:hypothetical protein
MREKTGKECGAFQKAQHLLEQALCFFEMPLKQQRRKYAL